MKKIVILGGGYGGVLTAKKLAKKFKNDKDVEIKLIDRNPYHTLLTELHEVSANRAPEDSIKIDLKKIFAGLKVDVVLDEVSNIDFKNKKLKSDKATYAYDYLVIGTGSKPTFFGIPGAEENTFSFWSYDDAVALKRQIRDMYTKAAKEKNPAVRRAMLTFVIIGAGFTGVELVGEMAEQREELCKEFFIDPSEVRLIVADMAPKVLPILPDKLIQKAEARLRKLNVEIVTSAKITEVGVGSVALGEKNVVEAQTIVWTAGVEGSEIVGDLEVQQQGRKRIVTNEHLESVDHKNVYVVGDNIFFIPEGESRPVPQMVENAEQAAPLVAGNIEADIKGTAKKAYKPAFHGTMVSIGSRYGVANVGLPGKLFMLTGFMAMLSKHVINMFYLSQVVGFNKVWTYMMHEFFHVENRKSFVGGYFSKRSPNFWLVPLRMLLGGMWLYEGIDKLKSIWDDPNRIFLIPAAPFATDAASSASVAAEAEAVTALPVPNFVYNMTNWFMDLMFYNNDGSYTFLAKWFQIGMVCAEIVFGIMLIVGLFTALSSIVTIAMAVMIWSSKMAATDMLWYVGAAIACIGGSGSVFGLDYYVLPWLKKQWKKIPLVRRWYLYTD